MASSFGADTSGERSEGSVTQDPTQPIDAPDVESSDADTSGEIAAEHASVQAPAPVPAEDPVADDAVAEPESQIPTAVVGAQPAIVTPQIHAPVPSRKARVEVRKVGPWSVLKFSLLFYLCVMLVLLLAGTMLYLALDALGTIDAAIELAVNLSVVEAGFRADGTWLFWRALTIGLIGVVLWSLINVFVTFLYNLISDVVGGIEITLGEKRSRRG